MAAEALLCALAMRGAKHLVFKVRVSQELAFHARGADDAPREEELFIAVEVVRFILAEVVLVLNHLATASASLGSHERLL